MKYLLCIAAGLVASVIGAGIWAMISYYTGYEIGIVAWGIGGLVGLAVAVAVNAAAVPPMLAGAMAAVLALSGVALGKWWSVTWTMQHEADNELGKIADGQWHDFCIADIANDVVVEFIDADTEMSPPPAQHEAAPISESYPREVWQEARSRWQNLPESQRQDDLDQQRVYFKSSMAGMIENMQGQAFSESLGFYDLIWTVLAAFSAFKLAAAAAFQKQLREERARHSAERRLVGDSHSQRPPTATAPALESSSSDPAPAPAAHDRPSQPSSPS